MDNQHRRNYGEGAQPLETPYARASQVWDSRIGDARVQAHNWRLVALGLLTLCGLLTFGLIHQSNKASVVPYIVEVSREQGSVRLVGTPEEQRYVPSQEAIKYFLGQWIQDVRSLPADVVVLKLQMERAYASVHGAAVQQLQQHTDVGEPLKRFGKEMVQVELVSLTALSDESYQAEWREKTYSAKGQLIETAMWTATLTVLHQRPEDASMLKLNPLGIYIKYFSWAKKIDAPAQ
jgi:type IV secretory pathway TrbF-like protein